MAKYPHLVQTGGVVLDDRWSFESLRPTEEHTKRDRQRQRQKGRGTKTEGEKERGRQTDRDREKGKDRGKEKERVKGEREAKEKKLDWSNRQSTTHPNLSQNGVQVSHGTLTSLCSCRTV